MPTILQITDPHLRETDETNDGVSPLENLRLVIKAAREYCPDPPLVIWTGDIADDASAGAYQKVKALIGDWLERSRWIPGNHDSRERMRKHLLDQDAVDGLISFSESVEGWRILGLDTQIPGETPGELRLSQWHSLSQSVNGEPILLFMHHPPAIIDCKWMDKMNLQNRDDFDTLLFGTSAVCATFSGHVHSAYEGNRNGVRICTTPSTAFQFSRRPDKIEIDPIPPGFRAIHLDGSTMSTEVIRLPELIHPPDAE